MHIMKRPVVLERDWSLEWGMPAFERQISKGFCVLGPWEHGNPLAWPGPVFAWPELDLTTLPWEWLLRTISALLNLLCDRSHCLASIVLSCGVYLSCFPPGGNKLGTPGIWYRWGFEPQECWGLTMEQELVSLRNSHTVPLIWCIHCQMNNILAANH